MTDQSEPLRLRDLPAAVFNNSATKALVVIFLLIELFNLAVVPAFLSTQKGIETKATAENAALRHSSEAALAEAKSINETEVARNAERKQRADARKATAEAQKAEAEATIASETATNSDLKSKSEAAAQIAEAEIKEQLTLVETEVARQSSRRQTAEADLAEEDALSTEYSAILLQRFGR